MTDNAGLTLAERAEIMLALLPVERICAAAASRELERKRPELAARLASAEADQAAAEARMEPPRAALEPLQAELAEVRRQLAGAQSVGEQDSLSDRLAARSALAALGDEERQLTQRVAIVQDQLSPVLADVSAARMQADRARVNLEGLDAAISSPLATPAGLQTEGGVSYLISTGVWAAHLSDREANTILGAASRKFLMDMLRETGLGAAIEYNALGHAKLQQDRKAGVVIDNGLVFASARGWDGSGAQPNNLQYTPASARAEMELGRWMAAAVGEPRPGMYQAAVKPMSAQPSAARDVSGIPSELTP